jgi:hypothetical protein
VGWVILDGTKMRSNVKLVLRRPQMPPRSVRLRLTALYGSLFLVSGAVLLTLTYLLVSNVTSSGHIFSLPSAPAQTVRGQPFVTAASQRSVDLHQMLVQSGIALALMTLISAMLGCSSPTPRTSSAPRWR